MKEEDNHRNLSRQKNISVSIICIFQTKLFSGLELSRWLPLSFFPLSLYVQLWLKWKQFQFLRKYKWLVFIYERVFYKTHKNCHFSYCCTFEMAISIHLQTNKSTSQLYSFLYMELIFRGKCGLRRSLAYFCHQALLSSFLRNQKNSKTSYLVNLGTCGTDQV